MDDTVVVLHKSAHTAKRFRLIAKGWPPQADYPGTASPTQIRQPRRGCAVPGGMPWSRRDPFRVESWTAFLSSVGPLRRPPLRYAAQPLRGIHSPAFRVLV